MTAARDGLHHARRAERLDDEAVGAVCMRLLYVAYGRVRTDHDDGKAWYGMPGVLERFKAIHLLHVDIQKEDVGNLGGALLQRFLAVARFTDDFNVVLAQ